jgi:hypothetical protein
MGCHLGRHFTVGCPLRGGRGEYVQKRASGPPKTIKRKKYIKINPMKYKCKGSNYTGFTWDYTRHGIYCVRIKGKIQRCFPFKLCQVYSVSIGKSWSLIRIATGIPGDHRKKDECHFQLLKD